MQYRRLGNTGLKLSEISLGTWISCDNLAEKAASIGIIDKSLKRLGVDYVDLYYCHWFDPATPVDETLRAIDDLVSRGKVLYVGVSNWTAAQISEGIRTVEHYRLHPIAANQPSYNMFDRYIEAESIPLCSKHAIGQVVYSPLAQGVLTGKYRKGAKVPEGSRAANRGIEAEVTVADYLHDELLEKVEQLLPIAAEMGLSLAQLALAWVLRQPNVSSALIGASRPQQVEENVKASGIVIPDDVMRKIDDVLKVKSYVVKHNVVTL